MQTIVRVVLSVASLSVILASVTTVAANTVTSRETDPKPTYLRGPDIYLKQFENHELNNVKIETISILSDDNHSNVTSSAHGTHPELFGSVLQTHINLNTYAIMLSIVIVSVNIVDKLFEFLNSLTYDTSFAKMIHVIEKELMIVGFTSFIFKVIISSSNLLEGRSLYAMEFADTLVTLYAFCNCVLGVILVFLTIRQSDVWSRAFHIKLEQQLHEYFEIADTWIYRCTPSMISPIISQLEFRIFHNIFCEMFNMEPSAIAFDQYISYVSEKFIHDILAISPLKWMLFGLIAMMEYARVEYSEFFYHCHANDTHCLNYSAEVLFVICGGVLFVVTFIFAIVSRRYESQLISMKGITHIDMYPAYLQYMANEHKRSTISKMKQEDLKRAVNVAKMKRNQLRSNKRSFFSLSGKEEVSILRTTSEGVTRGVDVISPQEVFDLMRKGLEQSVMLQQQHDDLLADTETQSQQLQQSQEPLQSHENVIQQPQTEGASKDIYSSTLNSIIGQEPHSTSSQLPQSELSFDPSLKEGVESDKIADMLMISAPEFCYSSSISIPRTIPGGGGSKQASRQNSRPVSRQISRRTSENKTHFEPHLMAEKINTPRIHRLSGLELENIYSVRLTQEETVRTRRMNRIEQSESSVMLLRRTNNKHTSSVADSKTATGTQSKDTKKSGLFSSFSPAKPSTPTSAQFPWRDVPTPPQLKASPANSNHIVATAGGDKGNMIQTGTPNGSTRIIHTPNGSKRIAMTSPPGSKRIANNDSKIDENRPHGRDGDLRGAGDIEMGIRKSPRNTLTKVVIKTATEKPEEKSNERMMFTEAVNRAYYATGWGSEKSSYNRNSSNVNEANANLKRKEKVVDVFLLSDPKLYFHASQILVVFISVYFALWLIYFLPSKIHSGYKVLTLLPGVCCFINYTYIVRIAAFIKAIVHIDNQAVLEIVEQTESSKALCQSIRDKILYQLAHTGTSSQTSAATLFNCIDTDEDGELSRKELGTYLNTTLEIYCSNKKWNQVFRSMCVYCNKNLSLDEFQLFLYPDHSAIQAQERSRLNRLKKNVSRKLKSLSSVRIAANNNKRSNKIAPLPNK